jgi:DNA-binding IscR family transcriptional regulator
MQMDARLSRMLHVLIHMDGSDRPLTSGGAATMLRTNAVVVRRTMAGLRDAGYVTSVKGHGGGWSLAKPLGEITMADIYRALGEPRLFLIGPASEAPDCLVEQEVNSSLASAFDEARNLLLARLGTVTLADIAEGLAMRLAPSGPEKGKGRL